MTATSGGVKWPRYFESGSVLVAVLWSILGVRKAGAERRRRHHRQHAKSGGGSDGATDRLEVGHRGAAAMKGHFNSLQTAKAGLAGGRDVWQEDISIKRPNTLKSIVIRSLELVKRRSSMVLELEQL